VSRYRPNAPPPRQGVSASCVVLPAGPWATVLEFLVQRFPAVSAASWQARLQAGELVDSEGMVLHPNEPATAGRRVYYYRSLESEPRIPFEAQVLWQDAHLLVADKPHFLPVIPSGKYVRETLLVRLRHALGLEHLSPIHRIDRDTAGLVLFSVNPETRNAYQSLFRQRQVDKTYHAIAPWNPALPWPLERASRIGPAAHFMQQTELDGAPNAFTTIGVLQVAGARALYELLPLTGQRHQLRVHMAALGLPIEGDGIYPTLTPEDSLDYQRPLQLLAKRLRFTDPLTHETRCFESQRTLHLDP
jgi:tRNA pseudouridine32 synthase / 23S rRNA pseudouridine746 synthase